jgi:hypothetical protein
MKPDQAEPAFPFTFATGDGGNITCPGMTLRDYFAGQVLAGLATRLTAERFKDLRDGVQAGTVEAKVAYTLADAMLTIRGETQ